MTAMDTPSPAPQPGAPRSPAPGPSGPDQPAAYLLRLLPLLAVAVFAALLVWPAFTHAWEVWSTDEEFSYGFLIPPISIALACWRLAAFRRAAGRGAGGGFVLVVASVAMYLAARRLGINALAGLAVIPLLWSLVVTLWGWRAARVMAFPIGFLAFGLGLYRGLLDTLGFTLQGITAHGAATVTQLVGLPITRDGLVLQGHGFAFFVAQACSGMNSLLSLLALASLWIYLARGTLPARMAIVASVLPLVIIANTTRVALVLLVASWFGQDAAEGFFHGASSLVLFGLALGGLISLSRVMGCKAPDFAV